MSYEFVLSDLEGVKVSELAGASSKSLSTTLRGIGSSTVAVRRSSPDARFLLECRGLCAIYEVDDTFTTDGNRRLLAHHRLIGADEVGNNAPTVSATFADPFWVLMRRFYAKDYPRSVGGLFDPTPYWLLITTLLNATNADSPSGLRPGVTTSSGLSFLDSLSFANVGETIQTLASAADGPEYRVRPIAYDAGYYGELDVADALSVERPSLAFEYGDGLLNVASFRRAITLDGTANDVYSTPPGYPNQAAGDIIRVFDVDFRNADRALEAYLTPELAVEALRFDLTNSHLHVRRGPRQTISFEPVQDMGGRVPKIVRDFNVGDLVPFRAWVTEEDRATGVASTVKAIDATVRIYGFSLSVLPDGSATPTLTISPT